MQDVQQVCEILERTPRVLRSLLEGVSDFWVCGNYGEGTWSAREVIGHLIAGEREDWMPRVKRIMQHGESVPFEPFAHDAVEGKGGGNREVSIGELLNRFESLRSESLEALAALKLSDQDLLRTGMHPALGRVTLAQLLSTWAVHDLHHVRQACLAMAWQYRDEVGPWRAYLNTLKR